MEIIEELNNYDVKSLILKIFTIGYNPMGESIVILIIAENVVYFSAVIDCYETKEKNITLEILEKYNVQKLDLICITHPDLDHCKGFERIFKKINSKTVILYPKDIFNEYYKDKNVRNTVHMIAELLKKRKNNKDKPILKLCAENMTIPLAFKFKNINNGYIYPLEINTYSPITEVIDRSNATNYITEELRRTKGMDYAKITESINEHNNLSIMLSLALGDFKTLFCGDIEDDSIEIIERDSKRKNKNFFIDTIDYIKIPHHCSLGSENMMSLLNDCTIANAVTTIYKKGVNKLPNEVMLKKYTNKSKEVYCTSNIKDEEQNLYKYGVVELTVDIFNRNYKIEEKKYDEIQI